MATKSPTNGKTKSLIVQNRQAKFNYELLESFEAGLVLIGSEVKTLRNASIDLSDGWVTIENNEAFLKGAYFPKLPHAAFGHEERRVRKLLLHSREIEQIRKAIDQMGMTAVPIRLYWKSGRAKVELALAKGKTKGDKRITIKERELDREARAAIHRGRGEE
jgi:SsrA-binding protein